MPVENLYESTESIDCFDGVLVRFARIVFRVVVARCELRYLFGPFVQFVEIHAVVRAENDPLTTMSIACCHKVSFAECGLIGFGRSAEIEGSPDRRWISPLAIRLAVQ